jgi:hypothetical protein
MESSLMKNVLRIAASIAVGLLVAACGTNEPTGPTAASYVPSGTDFSSSAATPSAPAEADSGLAQTTTETQRGGLMFGSGS